LTIPYTSDYQAKPSGGDDDGDGGGSDDGGLHGQMLAGFQL